MARRNRKKEAFLIVDDEPDLCWALERLLRTSGFSSEKALNGQEALALARKHDFRIAFVDVKLVRADGFDLAQKIREIRPGIQIIMVSGYISKGDPMVKQAQSKGLIRGLITKPFLHDEILASVRRVLSSAASANAKGELSI